MNSTPTSFLSIKTGRVKRVFMVALAAPLLLTAGCVTGANDYNRASVGVPSEIVNGRLVGIEPVRINGNRTGLGAASGAALGGALGSQVGRNRGYRGRYRGNTNVAGAIGFAILGGLVGAAIEEGATGGNGWRYTIELDDGRTITLVQGDRDPIARVGEPVRVEYGRRVRVLRG